MTILQHTAHEPGTPDGMAGQRLSGINCPVCRRFIPISIHHLLSDGGISCPHCGLLLTIDKLQSKPALDILKKVENAACHVRKVETFRR